MRSFKKYQAAKRSLSEEQDIRKMILMNRVTRLIHLVLFKYRQRQTVSYSARYVMDSSRILNQKEEEEVERS